MAGEGFKALADPTRRRILELLRGSDLTAGELAEHFDMSKPSLSHHLATLKRRGPREGRTSRAKYRIQPKHYGHAGFDRVVYGVCRQWG